MMHVGRKGVLAALATGTLLVAGCATETPYRPATGSGFYRTGYSDQQIAPGRFIVTFSGNTVTARDTVEKYLLFRSAQLTLEQGYDWFVLNQRDTDRQTHTYSTPGPFGPGAYGYWGPSWRYYGRGFGWRSWSPFWGDPFWGDSMDIQQVQRYEASAEIAMGHGELPRDNLRAFDAHKVVQTIGPTIVTPKP